jgi:hypothetical protein
LIATGTCKISSDPNHKGKLASIKILLIANPNQEVKRIPQEIWAHTFSKERISSARSLKLIIKSNYSKIRLKIKPIKTPLMVCMQHSILRHLLQYLKVKMIRTVPIRL